MATWELVSYRDLTVTVKFFLYTKIMIRNIFFLNFENWFRSYKLAPLHEHATEIRVKLDVVDLEQLE